MSSVRIWMAALGAMTVTIVAWLTCSFIYTEFSTDYNESLSYWVPETGDARETYNVIHSWTVNILRLSAALTIVFIIWAYSSMQRRERITGAYR